MKYKETKEQLLSLGSPEKAVMKRAIYCIPNVGMCYIDYLGEVVAGLRLSYTWDSVSGCERTPFSDSVFSQVLEYFAGERKEFDVAIDISHVTPFQQKILGELQAIPYGEVRTYKQLAEAIGNPKAARAVGSACNRNPIHLIIPCHRVIGANGALTGYAAGVEIKRQMLDIESGNK